MRQHHSISDELREQAALYSLGLLEPELSVVYKEHVTACALCRDEVRAFDEAASELAFDAEIEPPAYLRARVLASIQDPPDAISIVLGASSVDDAMTRLDAIERTARVDRQTVAQARAAQQTLARLRNELELRAQRVAGLEAQAVQTATVLVQARAQRVAYLASLGRQRTLNAHEIARLQASAKRITARSQTIAPPTLPSAVPSASPATAISGEQQLTVSATGYALGGTTATGMPVGWGVVAVDPSVIPLGTRMSIPGYGEGVAADTGSAVQGATIDLWFPTLAEAMAWGRRTVTITLH